MLGFETRLATYANTFLFPVVLLRRTLKKLGVGRGTDVKPLPRGLGWIDPIFCKVMSAEAPILAARRSLPFGLSVICCARKTSGQEFRYIQGSFGDVDKLNDDLVHVTYSI